jgi:hypothetical protein
MRAKIGSVVAFTYQGKNRLVRVGKVDKIHLNGWDYTANDTLGGGYRTFMVREVQSVSAPVRFNPIVVG